MRRLKMNHEQFVVIFMVAFIVTVGSGYFLYIESLDHDVEFRWEIGSDTQGTYWVVIETTEPRPLGSIHFRIEDPDGNVTEVTDPSGQVLKLEGRLSDIVHDWDDMKAARDVEWPDAVYESSWGWETFYSGVPGGKTNLTLFVVYHDYGERFTAGDFMLVRSETVGGPVGENHRILLSISDRNERIAEKRFPHAIQPLVFENRENQGDYKLNIIKSEPWPLKDVEYSVLNLNRLVARYKVHGEEFRMKGNVSDIVFDPDKIHGDVYRDIFYTSGLHDPVNITWYLVYVDSDSDDIISTGDTIWIRDEKNGGVVDEDFRIRFARKVPQQGIFETTMIRPTFELEWNVSVINGTYCIEIINTTRYHLDSINFNLTSPDGMNATAMSPDGEKTTIYGRLQNINFTLWLFEQANGSWDPDATFQDKFYAYDYGSSYWYTNRWRVNRTLFIILEDLDSNGRLSNGDKIWIRHRDQGGAAGPGYALALTDDRSYKAYPVIILP